MAKFDLGRETAREQLKEQKRQYDAQYRRDLGKIALSAGINLAGGVAQDWAGFELFGGKEKLDAYQRQIAEQEAAGADVRRQRDIKRTVAAGPEYAESLYDPQVRALQERKERLDAFLDTGPSVDAGLSRIERGPEGPRGLTGRGLETRKEFPKGRLSLETDFKQAPIYEEDPATKRIQSRVNSIDKTITTLEGEYANARTSVTPEGKQLAARLNRAIKAKENERDQVLALARAVHEGSVTWESISKKQPKPKTPMKRREFEDRSSAIWLDIVDLLPNVGEHRGSGDVILKGPYKDTGFIMTQEYWDSLPDDTKGKISAKLTELKGIEYGANKYRKIDPTKMPEISLRSKKQATSRKKEYASTFSGRIGSSDAAYSGWHTNWGKGPAARDKPRVKGLTQRDTEKFNFALTEFNIATQAYDGLGGNADTNTIIADATTSVTGDGVERSQDETRVSIARIVADATGKSESEADGLVRAYVQKLNLVDPLKEAAKGKLYLADFGINTTPDELAKVFTQLPRKEMYQDIVSTEETARQIQADDAKHVAALERKEEYADLEDRVAFIEKTRRSPEILGDATYKLLSGRLGEEMDTIVEESYPNYSITDPSHLRAMGMDIFQTLMYSTDPAIIASVMDQYGIADDNDLATLLVNIQDLAITSEEFSLTEEEKELLKKVSNMTDEGKAFLEFMEDEFEEDDEY